MIAVVIAVYPLRYFVVYMYIGTLEVYFTLELHLFSGSHKSPHAGGLRYWIDPAVRLSANISGDPGNRFDAACARGYPRFPYKDGKLWATLYAESIGLRKPIYPNRLSTDLSLRTFVSRDRGRPCPVPWHSAGTRERSFFWRKAMGYREQALEQTKGNETDDRKTI